ncbi:putative sucrose-phosphate synthase 3 isoform C [Glycine soja]|uniref:Putative sucrose-phosphate synthase 3 isoform A n=1 Tax=Glycine soja TaxID=3848 RepID=A0A445KZM4_GLYSO|nr:putative sucrose-phosphate synthase 3 isoform A [Glycine soja]RZC16197.1 putative sucrose-phosphate synthase 3 isoform B [Glycine soja]RZC16198.1 putative sucrose-phosphate synthase 3 isoform C [Glycine soja]
MSEDLSEGEKGDSVVEMVQSDTPKKKFQHQTSNLEVWSDDKKEKKLYVVLLRETSMQGSIDIAANIEGEHTSTGLQKETILKRKVKKPTYLKDFV